MPPRTVTTAEDLLGLDEPGFRFELVRGELRRMTGAGHWHGAVTVLLTAQLTLFVRAHRLGMTYAAETGFLLERDPDTVLCPDLAFVRSERVPPAGPGHFPGPPDLAVEVISPNDSFSDVQEKALRWLDLGARLVWVVDPRRETVSVFRSRNEIRALGRDDELSGEDVVPGFAVRVADLFPTLPSPPSS